MAVEKQPTMSVRDFVMQNKKLEHDMAPQFSRIFGAGLHQFMDFLTGFNVVKFDEWLGTPDGVSTADFIKLKYDTEALTLVERLL